MINKIFIYKQIIYTRQGKENKGINGFTNDCNHEIRTR